MNFTSEEVTFRARSDQISPNFIIRVRMFSVGQGGPAFLRLYTFNRLCVKLFITESRPIDVVKDCQSYFAIGLPAVILKEDRTSLFYNTFRQ